MELRLQTVATLVGLLGSVTGGLYVAYDHLVARQMRAAKCYNEKNIDGLRVRIDLLSLGSELETLDALIPELKSRVTQLNTEGECLGPCIETLSAAEVELSNATTERKRTRDQIDDATVRLLAIEDDVKRCGYEGFSS